MKVRDWHILRRALGWLVVGGWVLSAGPVLAALSVGFSAHSNIPAGTIVALANDGSGGVVTADTNSQQRMIGVVVASNQTSLSLGANNGQVQVVTSGLAPVLVSTANGNIKAGDPITLSSIAGVGMKATQSGRIIGIAAGSFSDASPGVQPATVGSGVSKREVSLGEVQLQVGVNSYSVQTPISGVLGAFQNIADTISGKTVAVVRLYIAAVILLAAVISATILIYSAVRNSIIAVGRNPLAKRSIFRSLAQILLVVVLILGLAAGAIYLVIKT